MCPRYFAPARPPSPHPTSPRAPLLALAALAICAGPAAAQNAANPRCPLLFTIYESTARSFGPGTAGNRLAPPQVQDAARQLRMGGCLTVTGQLAAMETLGPGAGAAARTPAGPGIAPTTLHAGIVTSAEDDARARAFFAAQGVKARSVGAPMLGRRIYIGPFSTTGALNGAAGLARAAGFAYPYPANF